MLTSPFKQCLSTQRKFANHFLCSFLLAGLAVGLGIGAIAEVAKKSLKPQQQGDKKRPFCFIGLMIGNVYVLIIIL